MKVVAMPSYQALSCSSRLTRSPCHLPLLGSLTGRSYRCNRYDHGVSIENILHQLRKLKHTFQKMELPKTLRLFSQILLCPMLDCPNFDDQMERSQAEDP